jgi:hypothetical protein
VYLQAMLDRPHSVLNNFLRHIPCHIIFPHHLTTHQSRPGSIHCNYFSRSLVVGG